MRDGRFYSVWSADKMYAARLTFRQVTHEDKPKKDHAPGLSPQHVVGRCRRIILRCGTLHKGKKTNIFTDLIWTNLRCGQSIGILSSNKANILISAKVCSFFLSTRSNTRCCVGPRGDDGCVALLREPTAELSHHSLRLSSPKHRNKHASLVSPDPVIALTV